MSIIIIIKKQIIESRIKNLEILFAENIINYNDYTL